MEKHLLPKLLAEMSGSRVKFPDQRILRLSKENMSNAFRNKCEDIIGTRTEILRRAGGVMVADLSNVPLGRLARFLGRDVFRGSALLLQPSIDDAELLSEGKERLSNAKILQPWGEGKPTIHITTRGRWEAGKRRRPNGCVFSTTTSTTIW